MKYKDLCNKAIGDMNKEELFEFANGLLEEVWNYEDRIDKTVEYLKLFDDNSTLIDHSIIKGVLNILGDKE